MSEELRQAIRGGVLLPGDEGFERAAKPWTVGVEQPVTAVVEAADADDVAALVRHAKAAGLTVATQPSGHGASGNAGGAILLRTGRLDDVEVRPGERVARVGAGVKWGAVLAAAGEHGLTGLAGSSPVVSVTGYTLGGGLSWFSRRHGFAADAVRAFEVVDADGERAEVTAASDPELFWALRGGGGDYALVTAVEFDLFPAPALYGGRMVWPEAFAEDVFAAYGEVTASAPAELAVWVHRFRFPGAPPIVAVDAAYLGAAGRAEELLRRFDRVGGVVNDTRGVLPVAELGAITAEPTDPSPALSRAELLTDLDAEAVKALLAEPVDPLVDVLVRHLGGALAAPGAGAGASGAVTEPYMLSMLGLRLGPNAAEAVAARQEAIVTSLGDRVSGRKPFTFLNGGETASDAFDETTLERLRKVKRDRDPQGVFRSNFPV